MKVENIAEIANQVSVQLSKMHPRVPYWPRNWNELTQAEKNIISRRIQEFKKDPGQPVYGIIGFIHSSVTLRLSQYLEKE